MRAPRLDELLDDCFRLIRIYRTVLLTKPDDVRTSARIVGAGQIRLPSGEVFSFGAALRF
jgi:hypothetical protein